MTNADLTHPKYRPDIDGLRAIAVLSVVGFHAFPSWVRGGFIGVDIFFVISGFLISTIIFKSLARGEFSFRDFYSRRIRRIFPSLVTVLMATFVAGWFVLYPDEYRNLGKHIFGGAGFVSNFVLWRESGYFDAAAETKPLLHLWSLGIEEQYYILFPLMMWAAWRRRFNLLSLTILIGLTSFLLNVHYIYKDPVWTFYQPQTRVWELMVGSVLALLMLDASETVRKTEIWLDRFFAKVIYQPGANLPQGYAFANFKSSLGFFLVVVGLLLITKQTHFPGKWAVLPTVGTALMIWAGPQAALNRQLLSRPLLVWVGKISYPLYLWHWVILVFLRILSSESPSNLVRGVAVALAIVLSWLTYRFIEQPLRFGGPVRKKTVGLVIAMVVIAVIGLVTYKSNGFDWRKQDENNFLVHKLSAAKKNGPLELSALGGYTCFQLPPDKSFDFYVKNDCIPSSQIVKARNSILLIGDSHSASLSLGLRPWAKSNGFDYYQISSGACSLFSDDIQDNNCQQYSRKTFEAVLRLKPDILVIDSFWSHVQKNYFKNNGKWPTFIDYISDRFSYVSTLGAKKVVLVGEVPSWKTNLPDVLLREFVAKGKQIPERSFIGINRASIEMDQQMRGLKYPPNFTYFSVKDMLCNSEGCMTSVGADLAKDVVVWDYGHLTASGAKFVVDNALGMLILKEKLTFQDKKPR